MFLCSEDNMEDTEAVTRSSSVKKSVVKNFAKFTGKHLHQSHFIKKETLAQVFSCEFYKIFKNTFFYRTPPVAASASSMLNVLFTVL